MLSTIFNNLIYQPIWQSLSFLYELTGSFGIAIIVLTLVIRVVLIPLTLPAMRSAVKMRELKPELDKLKAKHKDDKMALQQAQLDLFRQHQINPAAGCLPYIIQFIILIALYRVFVDFLQSDQLTAENLRFLWFNLAHPDKSFILPIMAGLSQLLLALMLAPAADTAAERKLALDTKTKKDDEKADDLTEMAASMQQQMLFVMPIMTVILAVNFPAGLALYWIITTLVSAIQQYLVSGWGGLPTTIGRVLAFIRRQ